MDIGTRVRITEAVATNAVANGEELDYSGMIGATAVIVEDPIPEVRQMFGVDVLLPHTVLLDDVTRDPNHDFIAQVDPDHLGVIYLADDEVEVITENTEDTVNA